MIDWQRAQERLRVKADGDFGPVSYAALLPVVAGSPVPAAKDLGAALAAHISAFEVDATPERLAKFLGQCCHESARFTRFREIWGPTVQQLGYEGRRDLGNIHPGDGRRYCGRGLIDITGFDNYAAVSKETGLDLVSQPELAEIPSNAAHVSLAWWKLNRCNTLADNADDVAMTKKVNGGRNGLVERIAYTNAARKILAP